MDYRLGLRVLKQYVKQDETESTWQDFNLYRGQLEAYLRDWERFGDSDSQTQISRVVDRLNPLAFKVTGQSFTDLCLGEKPLSAPAGFSLFDSGTPSQPAPSAHQHEQILTQRLESVRHFLTDALGDEQIATLCFDHFSTVYDNLGSMTSKGQKIQALLEHGKRNGELAKLVELVGQKNVYQFERYRQALGL